MFFQNAQPQKFRYHLAFLAVVLLGGLFLSLASCSAEYPSGTSDKTVTETVTATATPTTVTATVTVVQTVSATNTATSLATNTATATPTQTATAIATTVTATAPEPEVVVAKSGGVDQNGRSILLINGRYCANSTATLVGDCAVEGIYSWQSGKTVTKNAQGWFTFALEDMADAPEECHVSLRDCGNPAQACTGGGTWADYGCADSPAAPGTQKGGPFMWCGDYLGGGYTCQIAFERGLTNGQWSGPVPMGNLPNGP